MQAILDFIAAAELDQWQWILFVISAFIAGTAKAGIKGITIIAVPLMAIAFGSKASTGLLLLVLIVGDIVAVWYYNRHADWKQLLQLLPWVIIGILIGVFVGKDMPEIVFKRIMATIILISVGLLFWLDQQDIKQVPKGRWFAIVMGLLVGFTTMIGNLAGPFANLFFLAMQFSKQKFIGTAAWLFFIVNLFKVPFHVFQWQTITASSFKLNLLVLPVVLLGFFVGIHLVRIIKERHYRRLILLLTAIGAILIFFK